MNFTLDQRMGRRNFLQIAALALSLGTPTVAAEDRPNTHNMLVFGEHAVSLSPPDV